MVIQVLREHRRGSKWSLRQLYLLSISCFLFLQNLVGFNSTKYGYPTFLILEF